MTNVKKRNHKIGYRYYLNYYLFPERDLSKIKNDYQNTYYYWISYIAPFISHIEKGKALDIGSTMGRNLFVLKKLGFNPLGIDLCQKSINFVKQQGFQAEKSDAFSFLKNKKNQYSLIVISHLIEHFKKNDALRILKLTKKALKKDGVLIIDTFNGSHPFFGHAFGWDPTHETVYTTQSLNQMLNLAGFQNNNVFSTNSFSTYHPNYVKKLFRKYFLAALAKLTEKFWQVLAITQGIILPECRPTLISISQKSNNK